MKKVLQELFGRIFLGAHTVQTVPKCIWMRHWLEHGNTYYSNTASSTSRWQNRCEKANKRQESTLLETIFSVFFQSCLDWFSCADSVIKVMMSSVVMFYDGPVQVSILKHFWNPLPPPPTFSRPPSTALDELCMKKELD